MNVAAAALEHAGRGRPVFPVDPVSKRPLERGGGGFKAATTDVARIRAWWQRWPGAGLAIPTGRPTGIVVIDVDPRHGGADGVQEAADRLGSLPPTLRASTPSGGWHYFLTLPADAGDIPNSAGKLAEGVDVRGTGGYVVIPPGRGREWTVRRAAAVVPDEWACEMRSPVARPDELGARRSTRWEAIARDGLTEGGRHDGLQRLIAHLLAKHVTGDLAAALVHAFNERRCRPPLDVGELDAIIAWTAEREAAKRLGSAG